MLVSWSELHAELFNHFYQHNFGLEEGEMLSQAASGSNAKWCEDIGQILVFMAQPARRVEVVRVGEVFLIVHVMCPPWHNDVTA